MFTQFSRRPYLDYIYGDSSRAKISSPVRLQECRGAMLNICFSWVFQANSQTAGITRELCWILHGISGIGLRNMTGNFTFKCGAKLTGVLNTVNMGMQGHTVLLVGEFRREPVEWPWMVYIWEALGFLMSTCLPSPILQTSWDWWDGLLKLASRNGV